MFQSNIKASERLQAEILSGIKQGESIHALFLKAVKAIGLMTANNVFRKQIEADMMGIYGAGLLEPMPLMQDYEATEERLSLLRRAASRAGETSENMARIGTAVKAHEARLEHLQKLLPVQNVE